ncbi:hypothetical protein AKO1_014874 [Acrasis kona]|uniref:Uncharacterized protein n=1 Tax=Acrasis kona TaxID=1008807 RepID=A0AAW2Z1R5_9EUKA
MSQRRHVIAEQEQFSDLPIPEKKYEKTFSSSEYLPLAAGLSFVLIFTFCALALPVLLSNDWKEICERTGTCYPDKSQCDCKCFDGINKRGYGRGGYKYIYYNSEKITFIIFGIVATYIILAYKSIEYLTKLLLSNRLNFYAFIAFAATVFPNFYAANMHFNYFNDNIHHLHLHQLYFSVTELLNAICILKTAHNDFDDHHSLLSWTGLTISVTHMVQSLKDQTIENLFGDSTKSLLNRFIPARDVAFSTCDFILLQRIRLKLLNPNGAGEATSTLKRDLLVCLCVVIVNVVILSNVTFGG